MMKCVLLFFCFSLLWHTGCKKSSEPVIPDNPCITGCDTCDTYAPISAWDSLYNIPRARYTISRATYNTARYELIGRYKYYIQSGLFIYNMLSKETKFVPSWGYDLFNDGRRIVNLLPNWGGIYIYDLQTGETTKIIEGEFVSPSLSLDEKYIFADSAHRTFRISLDGLNREALTDSLDKPVQLDENHIIGITRYGIPRYGIRTFNLNTRKLEWVDFTNLPQNIYWGWSQDKSALSPDRSRILMDLSTSGGIWDRENSGLYLLDLRSRESRKVLKAQHWGQPYLATWSSNSTFFASYHCRKDTTAMLFEYDLNGNVLRQVTFKEMKLYP